MSSVLFVIDSYLSNKERFDVCKNLIEQIRKIYPENKILLLNKFPNSWGLDTLVDHYYYLGESFMVGYPPKEIIDNTLYERPYTYVTTSYGVFENWFPLVNVSDHVANMFNSFIVSANLAKILGYEKVFKIEYDTLFDEEEFKSMSYDIEKFEDFLFYGTRKEGVWAKPHHYLIDVHFIGYSSNCFDGYNFLKNDKDFWNLCEKIGYYGKWIEYIIPMTIEEIIKNKNLNGIHLFGNTRNRFPKTKMDLINNVNEWTESMRKIPKICRTGRKDGDSLDEVTLFYWNGYEEDGDAIVKCQIYSNGGEMIYEKDIVLNPKSNWTIDIIKVENSISITSQISFSNGKTYEQKMLVTTEMVKELNPRFIFK